MTTTIDGPVLLTGAAGFIGSHLARTLLAAGTSVVGVDNFDRFYARDRKDANLAETARRAESAPGGASFRFHEGDIRDAEPIRQLAESVRPGLIVHIAALAGVRPSIEDPARYASVNLDGLVSMLDAARASGCRPFLFASSSSVYGNNEKVPFAETDDVSEPISPYAATKRAGELICHTYSHLFDMAIASLRFFTVYGPAQRPDLAIMKFMRLISSGETIPMFGDGTTSRDYTYVADIVSGILAAGRRCQDETAASRAFCRIYNLGGSSPISLAEMIEAIAETVGTPARIDRQPMQPGDVNRTWADTTRSRAELGFDPQMPFADGLAQQWAWLREQG